MPLEVVDARGKEEILETPPSKSKKRRLVKASDGEPKKTKLLAFTMLWFELLRYAIVSV